MSLKSWLPIPKSCHFSLANLPFGVISTAKNPVCRPAVAIGEYALDMSAFASAGGFRSLVPAIPQLEAAFATATTLNGFAALGRPVHKAVRGYLQSVLREDTTLPDVLKSNESLREAALVPLSQATMHLPMAIGDYTDFFAGRNHAHNVGTLFRGAANALQPNYNHLPVAYHGRASSVVVSGTELRRPRGQVLPAPGATTPVFRPSQRVDMELELGMFVCKGNRLGEPIPVGSADEHIFGYVLMNDWSARDLQTWEYVPLGPFNAKNFGTSISAWVVLADAMEPFRTAGLDNEVELQSYLVEDRKDNVVDINLEVRVTTEAGGTTTVTKTSSKNLLWSWPQMLAHHTVAGCNMRTGDLLGSGTISGLEEGTHGSMLEQNQAGKKTIKLEGGEERKFFLDGDTVTMTGWAGEIEGEGVVGFGECVGKILPAV